MALLDDLILIAAIFICVSVIVSVAYVVVMYVTSDARQKRRTIDYTYVVKSDRERLKEAWNDEYEKLTGERVYSWREYDERQDKIRRHRARIQQRREEG